MPEASAHQVCVLNPQEGGRLVVDLSQLEEDTTRVVEQPVVRTVVQTTSHGAHSPTERIVET